MSRRQVPLTCSQANKKILHERCDFNISFVQKEGSKIVVVDEAGESTVVVDETMLLGRGQILITF